MRAFACRVSSNFVTYTKKDVRAIMAVHLFCLTVQVISSNGRRFYSGSIEIWFPVAFLFGALTIAPSLLYMFFVVLVHPLNVKFQEAYLAKVAVVWVKFGILRVIHINSTTPYRP